LATYRMSAVPSFLVGPAAVAVVGLTEDTEAALVLAVLDAVADLPVPGAVFVEAVVVAFLGGLSVFAGAVCPKQKAAKITKMTKERTCFFIKAKF